MKILVTGGSGYIGSHFIEHMNKKYPHATIVNVDIENGIDLTLGYTDDERYDAIYHFAASSNVDECNERPFEAMYNNVVSTAEILNNIKDGTLRTNAFIFASSAAVYAEKNGSYLYEEDETIKMDYRGSSYGQSKLIGERLVTAATHQFGLKAAIVRFSNVAGQIPPLTEHHYPETHLIPKLMNSENTSIDVYGDGSQVRDYIHIHDVVTALEKLYFYMTKPVANGINFFNISSGTGYSVNEVIEKSYDLEVPRDKIQVNYVVGQRSGDRDFLVLYNNEAKDMLHWSPTHSLKDILESYL